MTDAPLCTRCRHAKRHDRPLDHDDPRRATREGYAVGSCREPGCTCLLAALACQECTVLVGSHFLRNGATVQRLCEPCLSEALVDLCLANDRIAFAHGATPNELVVCDPPGHA